MAGCHECHGVPFSTTTSGNAGDQLDRQTGRHVCGYPTSRHVRKQAYSQSVRLTGKNKHRKESQKRKTDETVGKMGINRQTESKEGLKSRKKGITVGMREDELYK